MKSAWQSTIVALAAAALSVTVLAQGTDYSKIEFTAKKVSSNLYMLSGSPNVDVNHPTRPAVLSACWSDQTACSWWTRNTRRFRKSCWPQ